jgi:hypothetical protein
VDGSEWFIRMERIDISGDLYILIKVPIKGIDKRKLRRIVNRRLAGDLSEFLRKMNSYQEQNIKMCYWT